MAIGLPDGYLTEAYTPTMLVGAQVEDSWVDPLPEHCSVMLLQVGQVLR